MRSISNPVPGNIPTANAHHHSPSVPLSVYRELAVELQAAQAKIDKLNDRNQELTRENQELRQEVSKAISTVLRLQNFIDSQQQSREYQKPHIEYNPASHERFEQPSRKKVEQRSENPRRVVRTSHKKKVARPRPPVVPPQIKIPDSVSEQVLVEEQEVRRYRQRQPQSSEVNGWFLALAIILIVFTAFGAGYFIVRPLLKR
ncbi:MAG: hypothetical protein AAFX80_13895 [Cyanobacteria bacterium J06639_18]